MGHVVGVVPAGDLLGVDPAGWDPFGQAVGDAYGPAAFSVLAVMESA